MTDKWRWPCTAHRFSCRWHLHSTAVHTVNSIQKTASYVTVLSNSMGLTSGEERENMSAGWNKSLMFPLWLNVGWVHVSNQKNPVQSVVSPGQRPNGMVICKRFLLLGLYSSLGVGAVLFAFAFPLGVDGSIFSLFSYKSNFHWSDVCVGHNVFSVPLSGFWKDLILTGLSHWPWHHWDLLKEPAVLLASSNENKLVCSLGVGPIIHQLLSSCRVKIHGLLHAALHLTYISASSFPWCFS